MARTLYSQQKANLTRATRVSDPVKRFSAVVSATRKAIQQWESAAEPFTGAWPDDWSRWNRALDDAWWACRDAYVSGSIDSMPEHVSIDDLAGAL
ncbi:hypothetical protein BJD55_gp023 [Gordonia phage Yvonnetastic]|uniref:Uncharacterized protein n=1 Tax=Gordonia phage Yvonnetastic TaxID=1821566 RepID=A0A142K9G0_9CAUD|nr:hypothetical protein BJD55_gp023 [Gordonia phage Yvonnetastic]AMS02743.1 hypothetical protein SEA_YVONNETASTIC_199 [Gordonia phage Yvonnetastic]WKW86171.1 hypothetical protein SEA_JONJAMES_198 [Gordonia Phage JonJames]